MEALKKYWWVLLFTPCLLFLIPKEKTSEEITTMDMIEIQEEKNIKIDVKGAVQNPGVYELKEESRVEDAILKAGGLRSDADTSMINLGKRLTDEMVLIIYTQEEIEKLKKGNTMIQYIDKECVCPSIKNDGCIEEEKTESNSGISNTSKVSINYGTLKELMTLDGIGESKAKAIIEYREVNGPFQSISDLTKVSGIGSSTYEKIKDKITL